MNQNHGALVYAMAHQVAPHVQPKQSIQRTQIQKPTLIDIDSKGYTLSFQLSHSNSHVKELQWLVEFPHPMSQLSDIQTYFIQLHSTLLSPKASWLFTDRRMRIIVPTVACLGYITHIIGLDAFTQYVQHIRSPWFQSLLRSSFGSAEFLGSAIRASWYFAIAAHTLEGIYVAHVCLSILKLKLGFTLAWFWLTCLVGFPSTSRVLKLAQYQRK